VKVRLPNFKCSLFVRFVPFRGYFWFLSFLCAFAALREIFLWLWSLGCRPGEQLAENFAQLGFTETNLTDAWFDIDSAGVMSHIHFTNQVRVART
jgi:hypothetical protein